MKGKKTCDKCKSLVGVRTKRCPTCDSPFYFKPKPKNKVKLVEIDWKQLKKGDTIKAIKGTGPYVLLDDGNKHCIGHSGKFTVHGIHNQGIFAYNGCGMNFLWMGGNERCYKTNVYRRNHKIVKVKNE